MGTGNTAPYLETNGRFLVILTKHVGTMGSQVFQICHCCKRAERATILIFRHVCLVPRYVTFAEVQDIVNSTEHERENLTGKQNERTLDTTSGNKTRLIMLYRSFCSFHLGSRRPMRMCSAIFEAGTSSPVSGDTCMGSDGPWRDAALGS